MRIKNYHVHAWWAIKEKKYFVLFPHGFLYVINENGEGQNRGNVVDNTMVIQIGNNWRAGLIKGKEFAKIKRIEREVIDKYIDERDDDKDFIRIEYLEHILPIIKESIDNIIKGFESKNWYIYE